MKEFFPPFGRKRIIAAAAAGLVAGVASVEAAAQAPAQNSAPRSSTQSDLPSGFVYLRDTDPAIAQDMRYAGFDNFVGRPLPGYDAAECVLRREAAAALSQVQADLKPMGLGLKVYDCYRPARAARAMVQWANDNRSGKHAMGVAAAARSNSGDKRFFPRVEKQNLLIGYIAATSQHSTGTAVDLTLVELSRAPVAAFDPAARYGPCIAAAADRAPDDGIDMGTGFDCFDLNSHTRSAAIGDEQRRSRRLLVAAMAKRGFTNYFREWWHFSFARAAPAAHHDFPIRSRTRPD